MDQFLDPKSRNENIAQIYKRDRKQHLSVELNEKLKKRREERIRKSHNTNFIPDNKQDQNTLTPNMTKRKLPDSHIILDKLEENS